MAKNPELRQEAELKAKLSTRNARDAQAIAENVVKHAERDLSRMQSAPAQSATPAEPEGGASCRKIGAEHAISMLKLGFQEVTQSLVPLPDSNIRPLEMPGVFGNEAMPHIQDKDRSRSR